MKITKFFIFLFILPLIILMFFHFGIADNGSNKNDGTLIHKLISPLEAVTLIQKNKNNSDFIILDVRTSEEYNSGHIRRARLLDFFSSTFQQKLKQLNKYKTYFIYCRSGNRSGQTLILMKKWGFKKVYELNGGIINWRNYNLPL